MSKKPNLIVDLSFQFSLSIIEFTDLLDKNKKYVLSNQLFRSGTAIGVNIAESQNAGSREEFIFNMFSAMKEAADAKYWLTLCQSSSDYPDCIELIKNVESIERIAQKIIRSTELNVLN